MSMRTDACANSTGSNSLDVIVYDCNVEYESFSCCGTNNQLCGTGPPLVTRDEWFDQSCASRVEGLLVCLLVIPPQGVDISINLR